MKKIYYLTLLLLSACSCDKVMVTGQETDNANTPRVISVEDAMQTLDLFLSENPLPQTRSGEMRRYNKVFQYFHKNVNTRTDTDAATTEGLPTAYVINFENDEGFAVLGANEAIPDIIAVTESGHIDPVNLQVNGSSNILETDIFNDMDESEIIEFNENVTITDESLLYSQEDEDYYVGYADADKLSSELIRQGIESSYRQYEMADPWEGGASGATSLKYSTRSPLLSYSWNQNSPYNSYCKRGGKKQKGALTGCSTTAMAMIVAYNEFPQTLIIDDTQINYSGIKSGNSIASVTSTYKNQIALLMGGIFKDVKKITGGGFTLITPKQIEKCMESFKYSNVKRISASSLTPSMIDKISTMLKDSKPVFISAIPKEVNGYLSGHSWVIDGAKYSSKNTYLLHMNLGWSFSSNGYYSTDCLNPADAEEYDDPDNVNFEADYHYGWHFRIITYDVPASSKSLTIDL
jgi:hypothetical protein